MTDQPDGGTSADDHCGHCGCKQVAGGRWPEVLTAYEAADYLRLHYVTVIRAVNSGRLPGVRVGTSWRFSRAELDRVLRGETPQPTADGPASDQTA